MLNDDINLAVKKQLLEYKLNIKGVKELFKNFLFEVEGEDRTKIGANLISMLKVKYNKESPRKPPGIII